MAISMLALARALAFANPAFRTVSRVYADWLYESHCLMGSHNRHALATVGGSQRALRSINEIS